MASELIKVISANLGLADTSAHSPQSTRECCCCWEKITPEQIRKSFEISGQVPDFDPENVLCMKEGNSCHSILPKLKELLKYPSYQLDLQMLEPLP